MAHQLALPVSVTPEEIARKKSLGAALELCADLAGFDKDKQLQTSLGVDKATFSRWQAGTEGIKWDKFAALMDACGNDAPLLWMLHARGYDLHSIRRVETALERENRQLREQLSAARLLLIGSTR
jgi:hypothetical protein